MRVSSVDLITNDVNVLNVALRGTSTKDKYYAKTMIGLDAEEIIPKFYGFGLQSKNKFYDFSMRARDIVMRVVLNPNYRLNETYSDLRDDLYRAISSSRNGLVTIRLRDNASVVAEIVGQIVKFEVPTFSKIPELQMTIKCDDPIFRALTMVDMNQDDFLSAMPLEVTDAISTCPHGFHVELEMLTAQTELVIQDKEDFPDWTWTLTPSMGLQVGDIVRMSSIYSNKYVTIERASVVTPVVNAVENGSQWPVMFPGQNDFWLNVDFTDILIRELSYRPAFWGV